MNKIKCKVRLRRRRKVVQASCTACAKGSAVVERGTWRLLLIERHPPHTVGKTSQELRMLSSVTLNCQEFRFSIVRIVISASTVKSLYGR